MYIVWFMNLGSSLIHEYKSWRFASPQLIIEIGWNRMMFIEDIDDD